MGASYIIFGRAIPTYQANKWPQAHLALGTYAMVAAPIVVSKLGKKPAVNAVQASSKDEEDFIREFVRAAEEGEPKNV
ncbi:hypothetical protein DFQ27_009798 [Actinomortierella ambigua]|uniref:ATP synthase subunit K, mitochondrial n=1 Tax=Actinomortierella ambigua TaxID=1343610 RepID=A0A9P6QF00_9FUNG|nr:hypothetical protein DFQ27_009798 [Actinomortierella ambigua]